MVDFQLKKLNIYSFSDTHGKHRELQVPENVDIVICAGDAVEDNLVGDEYDDFIEWFAQLPGKWKIFVPGNHELSFELGQADGIIQRMTEKGIIVLEDAIEDCDGIIIGSIGHNVIDCTRRYPGRYRHPCNSLSSLRNIGRRYGKYRNPEFRSAFTT